MGIVSSAKKAHAGNACDATVFQSPMGIVSSAKELWRGSHLIATGVSIPDGDSFLREVMMRSCALRMLDSFNPRWG